MAENKNIDDDTRKRALAFVEKNSKDEEYRSDPYSELPKKEMYARTAKYGGAPAVMDDATLRISKNKQRVVTKKELEESGLSLRDFLNKERGLTRREDKKEDKVEAAKKQLKLGEKVSSEDVSKAKKQLGLAKGGMVKANCGASVPPAQKAKK